ncbi:thioesterase family protein [Amycolatopsis minnesotensis]|uniref:Fluoroacetyl-CoA-specific thioesterase-like domain-containing protein n=1 Tax=Amycolatopsis minnesotensis TaxID=337894 RepID=A0ABN2S0Q3_9PSEU
MPLFTGALLGRRRSGSAAVARVGETRSTRYTTQPADCVQLGGPGPEWTDKPPVVASYVLIRLCEQYCMTVLLEDMPHGHCSLGSGQHFDHRGPIAVGAEIETTVRCVAAEDLRSKWEVTVRDAQDVVGAGWMAFALVDKARFEARHVTPKYATLTIG